MSVFLIILRQELRLNFYHFEKILANFLFFVIFLSSFFLLAQNQENSAIDSIIVIWISLLSCLIFSATEFLKKDFEDGTIEQLLNSCDNFEVAIMAKMLANWLSSCLPILLAIVAIKPDCNFLILIFLASLAINFICCFCGSISILGNSAPMIGVIILPLIMPVLLISYGDFFVSLKLLFGITIFCGATSIFATTKIVKIASE